MMKPTKKRPAKRSDNPIIGKLLKLKYRINDAYRNGYDDIIREKEGIDDKNYVKMNHRITKKQMTALNKVYKRVSEDLFDKDE